MRFSTVFISSAFVLASMSVALHIEIGNMLVARFADSGFLAEVEARAYNEEPGHHRDHDPRILYDDDPFTPTNPRPNQPNQRTASTHGPSLHRRLRTYVSPNQVEARAYDEPSLYARARVPPTGNHRDLDTRILYDGHPPPNPLPVDTDLERTASTHGRPRFH